MLRGDAIPESGRQSGPIEEFDQEREVAFAESFFQIPERCALLHFQIRRVTNDKVEVAGLVGSSVDPAPVGPNFFLRKMRGNKTAQLVRVPGRKGENRISHVFDEAFRKAQARPPGSLR